MTAARAPAASGGGPGVRLWIHAARPRTLPAAAVPVLVGGALALSQHLFAPLPFLAALAAALWIQIGTNLANDYFDAGRGADRDRVGPVRLTQSGLVRPAAMRHAIVLSFAVAALCGIFLVARGGWPILAIGLLSIASGIAYTGGPYPLGYHGLGEIFVFIFFGLVAVAGTYYVQALRLEPLSLVLAVPIGLLIVAILVINNLRDADCDRRAGKRTLVVRFGLLFGRIEYTICVVLPFLLITALAGLGRLQAGSLLALLALPLLPRLLRIAWTSTRPDEQVAALGGTARLLLLFGVLLSVGLFL